MTRSFGGPGGKGGRGGTPPGRPGGSQWNQVPAQESSDIVAISPGFGKRTVAIVLDFAACYFAGAAIALVPLISAFLPLQLTMALLLLSRDFFFEGRGVGKNLMGLQVVDAATGAPCTLMQSIQRNIILFAPFLLLQVLGVVMRFVPIPWLNSAMVNVVNLVGMLYSVVVIPLEAYRVYSSSQGQRFGDEIAGTRLVESNMDFSRPLPR